MKPKPRKATTNTRRSRVTNRKPLWTWDKGLSQSAIKKFSICPEQFSLSYIEGVTSRKLSVPIEFGNLFHLCCEFQGNDTPEAIAGKCCTAYLASRLKTAEKSQHDDLQRLVGTVARIFPPYVKYWAKQDKDIKWVSREKVFGVPYSFNDPQGGKSESITLVGKRDGVYVNKLKRLCLFETKTKGDIDGNEIADQLKADFQTLFYLLTLKIETGQNPEEVLYNVVRRPGQRFTKTDTLNTYLDRIALDIKKRPDYYFARWRVIIAPGMLETFAKIALDPTLCLFIQWWRSLKDNPFDRWQSPYHRLNLPALLKDPDRHGRAELFDWVIKQQRANYYLRSQVFPELIA